MRSLIYKNFVRGLLRINRSLGKPRPIDHIVCMDIECTCDSPVQIYPMELIEIACIKLDLTSLDSKNISFGSLDDRSMFHSYVRPTVNPNLTLFCQELTGIMQKTVDESETADRVIKNMIDWFQEQELIDEKFVIRKDFALASCGNFDLRALSPVLRNFFNENGELPIYFREWINVKKTFVSHKSQWPKDLLNMLSLLGEEPSGRLHSAKDDCRNLAKVIECLHRDECKFQITSRL